MAKLSPQALAALWSTRVQSSVDAYKSGINSVSENPAQQAIAAKQRYIDGVNRAFQEGRYEAGLQGVTKESWKAACVEKGAANIASGARAGAVKVQRAEQRMGPIRDAIVASLPPRGSLEENIQRAAQMARQMAATRSKA